VRRAPARGLNRCSPDLRSAGSSCVSREPPALERAVKGARLGVAEQERDLGQLHQGIPEVGDGELLPHRVHEVAEGGALALEPARQGPDAHGQLPGHAVDGNAARGQVVLDEEPGAGGDRRVLREAHQQLVELPSEERGESDVCAAHRPVEVGPRDQDADHRPLEAERAREEAPELVQARGTGMGEDTISGDPPRTPLGPPWCRATMPSPSGSGRTFGSTAARPAWRRRSTGCRLCTWTSAEPPSRKTWRSRSSGRSRGLRFFASFPKE
jgi:hypothetical protein